MRWGIFWRTLKMKHKRCGPVIMAAMLLHNFLVDERELSTAEGDGGDSGDSAYFATFTTDRMIAEDADSGADTDGAEWLNPLVVCNDAGRPPGRPTATQQSSRLQGEEIRGNLARALAAARMQRPVDASWKRNQCGHVYAQ
jgi:hypothetical protein